MKVGWQTQSQDAQCLVWRLLDLSGMTNSPRDSRNYVRSGFVFYDNRKANMRSRVQLGSTLTLEIRFPNGVVKSETIEVVMSNRLIDRKPREASPGTTPHLTDPDKYFRKG